MNFTRFIFAFVAIASSTSLFAGKVELEDELMKADAWKMDKGWKIEDGKILVSSDKKAALHLKKKLDCKVTEFEAMITPMKAEGKGMKAVGLALHRSEMEYCCLALVERDGESEMPAGKYIELRFKMDKKWKGGEEICRRFASKSFNWEYGKAYKVELELDEDGIKGKICLADEADKDDEKDEDEKKDKDQDDDKDDDEDEDKDKKKDKDDDDKDDDDKDEDDDDGDLIIAVDLKENGMKDAVPALKSIGMKASFSDLEVEGE